MTTQDSKKLSKHPSPPQLTTELKEVISIIKMAHSVPPPEIVAAKALIAKGYTEDDVCKVWEEMDQAWALRTRNAIRDIIIQDRERKAHG